MDPRVRAIPQVPLLVPRSIRVNRIARNSLDILLCMDLDMALGMALEIATGGGMGLDIGVGREAYPYHAAYPNSSAELKFLSKFGYSRWNIIFPSLGCRKGST